MPPQGGSRRQAKSDNDDDDNEEVTNYVTGGTRANPKGETDFWKV